MFSSQLGEPGLDAIVGGGVPIVAAEVVDPAEQVGQLIGRNAEVLSDGLGGKLAILLVGILRPAATQQAEMLIEQSPPVDLGEAGQQFSLYEVAGGSEDDQSRGRGRRFDADHVQCGHRRMDLSGCHGQPHEILSLKCEV